MMQPQHLLLSFPIEVLSEITGRLLARDLAKLWNCGCKQLHEALGKRGGVKLFRLHDDVLYVHRWPSLIQHLPHLTELRITDPRLGNPPQTLQLTPALRQLMLYFNFALTLFLDAVALDPTNFQNLEDLCIEDTTTESQHEALGRLKTISSLTSLNVTFSTYNGSILDFLPPRLTKLVVNAADIGSLDFHLPESVEYFSADIGSSDNFGDLGDLPSGLLSFDFAYEDFKFALEEIAALPRRLTALDTNVELDDFEGLLTSIPPSLRVLKVATWRNYIPDTLIALLPRSLIYTDILSKITIETLKLVPPCINSLSLASNDLNIFANLPLALEKLVCYANHPLVGTLDGSDRLRLPGTLNHMEHVPVEILDYCTLPDGLLTLHFNESRLTVAHTLCLPSRLTKLAVPTFEPLCISHLPQSIRDLEIGKENAEFIFTADMARHLPSSLVHLSLLVSRVETGSLACLSSELTTLYITANYLDIGAIGTLNTPKMRFLGLTLKQDETGFTTDLLSNLPPRLRLMRYKVRNQQIKDIARESLAKLPPGLTRLLLPESPSNRELRSYLDSLDPKPSHLHPDFRLLQC